MENKWLPRINVTMNGALAKIALYTIPDLKNNSTIVIVVLKLIFTSMIVKKAQKQMFVTLQSLGIA